MSENDESVNVDDFEVVMDSNESNSVNESQFPGEIETGNMEEPTSSMDSSDDLGEPLRQQPRQQPRQHPVPKPRNRSEKDEHAHFKREVAWTKEKEELLSKKQNLEEEVQELKRRNKENLKEAENKKEMLQNKCEEFLTKNSELLAEKDEAIQTIKELQAKGVENQERIEELQSEVENLQGSLDDHVESHNTSLQMINGFDSKQKEYENTIQRLEEELAHLEQQNDLGNSKIVELEASLVQTKSDFAKERESLTKEKEDFARHKELYAELSSINDDMEREQHVHKTKIRELEAELQKKEPENYKLLQEKNEMRQQLQQASADSRKQMEKLSRELQSQKDQLENQLIATRLEQKRFNNANATHASELQEMRNKADSLREERDFYSDKCKQLEKGLKVNAEDEIKQLSQALEALNEENEVLRNRNIKCEKEFGLLNNKRSELESKLGHLSGKTGKLDDSINDISVSNPVSSAVPTSHPGSHTVPASQVRGSYTVSSNAEPTTQKQAGLKSVDSKQWYETEDGEKLLKEIYEKFKNRFEAGSIEIDRAVRTGNLSLCVTTEHRQKFEVFFPRNFPHVAFAVKLRGKSAREIMVPYNRNASSVFAAQVAQRVFEVVSTRQH